MDESLQKLESQHTPFFSVCVDLYNRGKTINKVIESICNQSCQDFEIVIVDNGSTDDSRLIVFETLKKYQNVNYKFFTQSKKHNEIEGWNSPIKFATGKFIAICEGDDYYSIDHLSAAKKVLSLMENVGLYVAGSKLNEFKNNIEIRNFEDTIKDIKTFSWCPPPSCIIFPRISTKGTPMLFDESFVWAAEYSLYLNILKMGYNIVENQTSNYVDRGYRFYLKDEKHMEDILRIRHEYGVEYSDEESRIADQKIFQHALHLFTFNLIFFKYNRNLIKMMKMHFNLSPKNLMQIFSIVYRTLRPAIKARLNYRA